jgi:hypothetical protein
MLGISALYLVLGVTTVLLLRAHVLTAPTLAPPRSNPVATGSP